MREMAGSEVAGVDRRLSMRCLHLDSSDSARRYTYVVFGTFAGIDPSTMGITRYFLRPHLGCRLR
jgi:hypothetical protein